MRFGMWVSVAYYKASNKNKVMGHKIQYGTAF